jgi:hypothetical protein
MRRASWSQAKVRMFTTHDAYKGCAWIENVFADHLSPASANDIATGNTISPIEPRNTERLVGSVIV